MITHIVKVSARLAATVKVTLGAVPPEVKRLFGSERGIASLTDP
jgi:hypothetical protein